MRKMNVCVLGLGRIGLTLSLALSSEHTVFGIDTNKTTVKVLNSGKSTFHEADLEEKLKKFIGRNFHVYEEIPEEKIDAFVICVGTPIDENNEPIMDHIKSASETIGQNLKNNQLVVLRSTIPVGTTRNLVIPILEEKSGLKVEKDFEVVFSPERIIEGKTFSELASIPQIIGGISEKSVNLARDLFEKISGEIVPVSDLETAEMIKLMDNTYRDTHFAFANQIALLCEKMNLNALECIQKANYKYPRNNIPIPSPGVGGPCLTKDPYILLQMAKKAGFIPEFITQSRKVNDYIPIYISRKITRALSSIKDDLVSPKIFVLGFAFKGNPATDDTRNSPTLSLVSELKKEIPAVYGYDPVVNDVEVEKCGAIPIGIENGFQDADCVIFMNNHKSFLDLDIKKLLLKTSKPCIFVDCWSMFKEIENVKGIIYTGVGINSLSSYHLEKTQLITNKKYR